MNRRGFIGRMLGAIGVAAVGAPTAAPAKAAPRYFVGLDPAASGESATVVAVCRTGGFAETLKPELVKLFEAECRHVQYGYDMVMRGDALKIERVG